jgi:spore coat protein JB
LIGGDFLDNNHHEQEGFAGKLPSSAPLANPYVPFQQEYPPKYEARKGLIRGTLFQGLDLPFMGMVNNKEKPITPLSELQALGFALQEMALYLDTHRYDKEALELYRSYQEIYHKGMMQYEKECGAMAHGMPSDSKTYGWLNDPWPWEYSKN